ncbi:hypothetical protein CYMTET_8219 [Cymbomonas tetramitiformis]|uniref:PPM-type phosphatase domain-containing protein n=1 Tax=Cymbomonas tetramitiformis TaxID=36881 RepID=A0AAE0GTW2_9CHLO|nr:hypothetical protein CYMTET_8219 [Cymbomonas tetramitiformis]
MSSNWGSGLLEVLFVLTNSSSVRILRQLTKGNLSAHEDLNRSTKKASTPGGSNLSAVKNGRRTGDLSGSRGRDGPATFNGNFTIPLAALGPNSPAASTGRSRPPSSGNFDHGNSTWPPANSGLLSASKLRTPSSRPSTLTPTSTRPRGNKSLASTVASPVGSPAASSTATPELPCIQHGSKSVGGVAPGFSKENQDDYFVIPDRKNPKDFYAGVMDGHGMQGKKVSGFIKDKLMSSDVKDKLMSTKGSSSITGPDDPSEVLNWAFLKTQSELKRSGIDCRESGSTTVACIRKGDQLWAANVGDSRCVLARMDGNNLKAVAMSRDHKPRRKDEMERILKSNGHVEPSRAMGGRFVGPARVWAVKQQVGGLAVSRAIGDTNLNCAGVIPNPEVLVEKIGRNDKMVILASDGVWEHLSNQDAVDIAKIHADDPKRASDLIVQKARDAWNNERIGYRDDITAVVVKLD